MKWEITFLFSVCIVYNAEKIFFSGDYRYPRFFKTCSEAKCKKREKFMMAKEVTLTCSFFFFFFFFSISRRVTKGIFSMSPFPKRCF